MLATIITPNIPESQVLCGKNNEVEVSASTLLKLGCNAALLKGGHKNSSYFSDLFLDKSGFNKTLTAKRIISKIHIGQDVHFLLQFVLFLRVVYSYLKPVNLLNNISQVQYLLLLIKK